MWPFKRYRLEIGNGINGWHYYVWRGVGDIMISEYGFKSATEATNKGIETVNEIRRADKLKKEHRV